MLFFSEDGTRIAYSTREEDGNIEVFWRPIDGSGQREVLAALGQSVRSVRAGGISPGGDQMMLSTVRPASGFDVGSVYFGEPDSYRDLISSPSNEYGAVFPGDRPWLAFGSDETQVFEIYVQRFPNGSGRRPVTIGGGAFPFWTADGRNLVYVGFSGGNATGMVRLQVSGLDDPDGSPVFGSPELLFPWRYYTQVDPRSQFVMTADGERFLMISNTSGSVDTARMILVQNWFEELKSRVP